MEVSLITWNIHSAPSMYRRLNRRKGILNKLKSFSKDTDIIILQETDSFGYGMLSSFIYKKLENFFYNYPAFMCAWDYLAITEGYFFPYKSWDNSHDIEEYAKKLGYKYNLASRIPVRYYNSGLLILSKFPLSDDKIYEFKGDIIHTPGLIMSRVNFKNKKSFYLGNAHLIPELTGNRPSYLIAKFLNFIFRKNTLELRHEEFKSIKKHLPKGNVIIGGDYNIEHGCDEYHKMLNYFSMRNSNEENIPTHIDGNVKESIDYFIFSKTIKHNHTIRLDHDDLSDHFPLKISLDI